MAKLLAFLLAALFLYAGEGKELLTPGERAFLAAHPTIVLGTERSWEPYVIVQTDGTVTGYDADVLEEINRATGARFVLRAGEWREMQALAERGEIDGLSTGGVHEERKRFLAFSDCYVSLKKMALVPRGNPQKLRNPRDLAGKTIVIHRGNLVDEKIAGQYPRSRIVTAETVEEMIHMVLEGEADATFGNGSTLYMANKLGLPFLETAYVMEQTLDLAFGVRKEWPEAVSILNKGLHAMGEQKRMALIQKWFFDHRPVLPLVLTSEEKEYLAKRGEVRMCADPAWVPYDYVDERGKHQGIAADLMGKIAARLETPIRLVPSHSWTGAMARFGEGKCDILPLATRTPERERSMTFTTPLLSFPMVVLTREEKGFIDDFEKVAGETFALPAGYASGELLRQRYPGIRLEEVENYREGLARVKKGGVFGYIDNLVTINYLLNQYALEGLAVTGSLNTYYDLAVAVRNDDPLLAGIFRKAVLSLDEMEKEEIIRRHTEKSGEPHGVSMRTILWSLLALAPALLVFLAFSRYRAVYYRLLDEANDKLETRVAEEAAKNREQERMLFQKAKLASMGELVGNIAHQWRQPLAELGAHIMRMDAELRLRGSVERNTQEESIRSSKEILTFLSQTIETFLGIFRNGGETRIPFPVKEEVEKVLFLSRETFRQKRIRVEFSCDETVRVYGLPDGFAHALLALFRNAADHFTQEGTPDPMIRVAAGRAGEQVRVAVTDNGGGIRLEPIEKIFEPYVSSKRENGTGTGIGLFIAKTVVEEKMGGRLEAENVENGARFTIILPAGLPG